MFIHFDRGLTHNAFYVLFHSSIRVVYIFSKHNGKSVFKLLPQKEMPVCEMLVYWFLQHHRNMHFKHIELQIHSIRIHTLYTTLDQLRIYLLETKF